MFSKGLSFFAFALSHSVGLYKLDETRYYSLIVNDIYDTEYTFERIKHLKGSKTHGWVSKREPTWWNVFKYIKVKELIIFTWEKANASNNNKNLYYKLRY